MASEPGWTWSRFAGVLSVASPAEQGYSYITNPLPQGITIRRIRIYYQLSFNGPTGSSSLVGAWQYSTLLSVMLGTGVAPAPPAAITIGPISSPDAAWWWYELVPVRTIYVPPSGSDYEGSVDDARYIDIRINHTIPVNAAQTEAVALVSETTVPAANFFSYNVNYSAIVGWDTAGA